LKIYISQGAVATHLVVYCI